MPINPPPILARRGFAGKAEAEARDVYGMTTVDIALGGRDGAMRG
jgi:hypothetical protein